MANPTPQNQSNDGASKEALTEYLTKVGNIGADTRAHIAGGKNQNNYEKLYKLATQAEKVDNFIEEQINAYNSYVGLGGILQRAYNSLTGGPSKEEYTHALIDEVGKIISDNNLIKNKSVINKYIGCLATAYKVLDNSGDTAGAKKMLLGYYSIKNNKQINLDKDLVEALKAEQKEYYSSSETGVLGSLIGGFRYIKNNIKRYLGLGEPYRRPLFSKDTYDKLIKGYSEPATPSTGADVGDPASTGVSEKLTENPGGDGAKH